MCYLAAHSLPNKTLVICSLGEHELRDLVVGPRARDTDVLVKLLDARTALAEVSGKTLNASRHALLAGAEALADARSALEAGLDAAFWLRRRRAAAGSGWSACWAEEGSGRVGSAAMHPDCAGQGGGCGAVRLSC